MDVRVRKKKGSKMISGFWIGHLRLWCHLVKWELKEGEKRHAQFWIRHTSDIFMGKCPVGGWKFRRLIWIEVKIWKPLAY